MPNCVAFDPCFGYERVILRDGMRRMLAEQEDVFYYVTVMNENYAHPAMPEGVEEGILRGMYKFSSSSVPLEDDGRDGTRVRTRPRVQLLGAGTILREVIAASELLEKDWGVAADVWSVTSFTELRREGMDVERHNRLNIHPVTTDATAAKPSKQPRTRPARRQEPPGRDVPVPNHRTGDCRQRLHARGARHDPDMGAPAATWRWEPMARPRHQLRPQFLRGRSLPRDRRCPHTCR